MFYLKLDMGQVILGQLDQSNLLLLTLMMLNTAGGDSDLPHWHENTGVTWMIRKMKVSLTWTRKKNLRQILHFLRMNLKNN